MTTESARSHLAGKTIVLGVTGSIAAFKAVALASELTKRGALVDVIMTDAARQFVGPLSFQAITHRPVNTEMFALLAEVEIGHISLGQRADALVIAPATANVLAELALGLADNLLLTTALATRAPTLIAPAMEPLMYSHPATEANVAILKERGAVILEPKEGRLASGRVGRGRMVEPAEIVAALEALFGEAPSPAARRDYAGRRVVVSAGPCHEPIDPVRYIANRSSGKMGYSIAEAARDRGADVVLVSGPTALGPPEGVRVVPVETALEMQAALESAVEDADLLVMAAAVADYRVENRAERKIKRERSDELMLRLVRNPDILAGLRDRPLFKVGFAAETDDVLANARAKLARKGAQMLVANDVTSPGSGFGTDTNQVILLDWLGGVESLPLLPKREVADAILDRVLALWPEHARSRELS
jgi:phosphopantothenoylcysteine decarboxylase / phosphopantothenate---cysteine ligase